MYKIIGSDQKVYGPVDAEQLRRWIEEGSSEWKPLSSVPEFELPPAPPSPPPPLAPAPPPPSPPPFLGSSTYQDNSAMTGFVCGLLSLVPCCCLNVIFAILGIIFSATALSRANRLGVQDGRTMAIIGLILSLLGLSGAVLVPWLFQVANGHPFIHNWHHSW